MSKVPQLRFPEFSGEWGKNQIQELIDNESIVEHLDGNHGELYPKSSEFSSEGIPYVSANDFVSGKVNFELSKKLPTERAEKFKKGIAKDGDVLFAHNATVGPVALLETDFPFVILSTTATYFRCDKSSFNNKFLKYALSSPYFVMQYRPIMKQSTRNQVPITTQRKLSIPYPTLNEQQKIADFFTLLDQKIEKQQQKIEHLEQYKKGIMQQLFSRTIRFKDENGNDYPEWEVRKLGEISEIVGGGTPSKQRSDYWNGNIPWISSSDISDNSISKITKTRYITNEAIADSATKLCPKETILIVSRVGVGKVAVADEALCTSQDFTNIIEIDGDKNYYAYFLSEKLKKEAEKSQGTSIKGITMSEIKELLIESPILQEQQKISRLLSLIDNKIEIEFAKTDSLELCKKGFMKKMFV